MLFNLKLILYINILRNPSKSPQILDSVGREKDEECRIILEPREFRGILESPGRKNNRVNQIIVDSAGTRDLPRKHGHW